MGKSKSKWEEQGSMLCVGEVFNDTTRNAAPFQVFRVVVYFGLSGMGFWGR